MHHTAGLEVAQMSECSVDILLNLPKCSAFAKRSCRGGVAGVGYIFIFSAIMLCLDVPLLTRLFR